MRAAGAKTLPSELRYYRSFDLLIIDEFGFDKLEHREYPESPSTTETAAKQANIYVHEPTKKAKFGIPRLASTFSPEWFA